MRLKRYRLFGFWFLNILRSLRKRNMKIAKTSESDAHKTSRTSKDRKWPRQKVDGGSQPIRGQKQEITTNREAAETKDQTALPSVVRTDRRLVLLQEEASNLDR